MRRIRVRCRTDAGQRKGEFPLKLLVPFAQRDTSVVPWYRDSSRNGRELLLENYDYSYTSFQFSQTSPRHDYHCTIIVQLDDTVRVVTFNQWLAVYEIILFQNEFWKFNFFIDLIFGNFENFENTLEISFGKFGEMGSSIFYESINYFDSLISIWLISFSEILKISFAKLGKWTQVYLYITSKSFPWRSNFYLNESIN